MARFKVGDILEDKTGQRAVVIHNNIMDGCLGESYALYFIKVIGANLHRKNTITNVNVSNVDSAGKKVGQCDPAVLETLYSRTGMNSATTKTKGGK